MRWTMGRVLQTLLSNRPTLPCIQMSPIYFPAGVLYILFQREICFSSFDFEANVFLSVLWGQNIFQPLCSSYCCGREIYFCLNFEANIFVPAGVLYILFWGEICCCHLWGRYIFVWTLRPIYLYQPVCSLYCFHGKSVVAFCLDFAAANTWKWDIGNSCAGNIKQAARYTKLQ